MQSRDRQEVREQYWVLRRIEDWLEIPMFIVSLLWVALLVIELVWGTGRNLERVVTVLWAVLILEFVLRFVIAPKKLSFFRRNWLTVFALVLPALQVFRVARVMRLLRASRAVRGLTFARVITSFNRGLRSLQRTMGRFGFGYVLVLTFLVTLLGSAGMFAFERRMENGLRTFGDALWFTAMLMTTSGSDYWPKTLEGRMLCFLLALYAFAIFGYVTATLATLLVGQDARQRRATPNSDTIELLRKEIAALHERLEQRRS